MQTYLATHEDLVGVSGNSLSLSRGACFIMIHLGQLSGNFDTTVEIHWVCPDRRVSSWSILGGVIKLRGVCFGLWDPLESPPSISILGGGELYHSHHHHQYHCVLDYLPHHLHVLVCETCWRAPNSSQSWVGTRSIQLHCHLIILLRPYRLILQ